MSSPLGKLERRRRLAVRIAALSFGALLLYELLRRSLDLWASELTPLGGWFASIGALAIVAPLAAYLARALALRVKQLAQLAGTIREDQIPPSVEIGGEDEVARIAAALNRLREQLNQQSKLFDLKDLRRREWFAQVSHDLRTPLMAQAACLDQADLILHSDDVSLRRSELRELIAVAKLDGDRVNTLADDLLEIARLDAGDRLNVEPVPPGEIIRQAAKALEPLASQRGLELNVSVAAGLPILQADGRRLLRAIENLLRNAIQHANSAVEISASEARGKVRFEVRDDGAGLPKQPDFLDYLRRRSSEVRLAELSKRGSRPDSAGLGLAVAQRVVEAHDGVIDAYNLSQGGAAFWMDIPVTDSAPERDEEEDPSSENVAD